VSDLSAGPKEPKSTVLSIEEEAIIVAFRRHRLLFLTIAFALIFTSYDLFVRSSQFRRVAVNCVGARCPKFFIDYTETPGLLVVVTFLRSRE
jgi:hypothetical protein